MMPIIVVEGMVIPRSLGVRLEQFRDGKIDLEDIAHHWHNWRYSLADRAWRYRYNLSWLYRLSAAVMSVRDDVQTCQSCSELVMEDEMYDGMCLPCDNEHGNCSACGCRVHYDEMMGGYCSRCHDNLFQWCEECGEYVHVDDEHPIPHAVEYCCETPHPVFVFPANGHGTIGQDERFKVTLPAGTIDDTGIVEIIRYIEKAFCDAGPVINWMAVDLTGPLVRSIGPEWQLKSGNFTRRLASAFHKNGIKLPTDLLSEVGNKARAFASNEAQFDIEVTRDLNKPAEDFYHGDSCWFGGGSYGKSRCAFHALGGIALRTFGEYGDVLGRAWVQPLAKETVSTWNGPADYELVPTFDVVQADAFMVYNGYGNLSGYVPSRIIAHLADMTYRKIGFGAHKQYVNNSVGYLVSSVEVCGKFDYVNLDVNERSGCF